MLMVGVIVFGGCINVSTIVRASLRGMSVSRRRSLLVRSAKRHHNRMQILQRQAENYDEYRKFSNKLKHVV